MFMVVLTGADFAVPPTLSRCPFRWPCSTALLWNGQRQRPILPRRARSVGFLTALCCNNYSSTEYCRAYYSCERAQDEDLDHHRQPPTNQPADQERNDSGAPWQCCATVAGRVSRTVPSPRSNRRSTPQCARCRDSSGIRLGIGAHLERRPQAKSRTDGTFSASGEGEPPSRAGCTEHGSTGVRRNYSYVRSMYGVFL